ncbi:MAG: aldehyde dehydrogenase family protein [Bdellovibrionota bacterium]
MDVFNPATGALLNRLKEDSSESIKDRFQLARRVQPEWARLSLTERHNVVRKFRDLVAGEVESLAELLTSEMGKPLAHSRGEIKATLGRIDWFLERTEGVVREKIMHRDGQMVEKITFEPLGVIANISAWNFPYFVGSNVFIPALLCGNAVLYKPSELTVLTGLRFESLMRQAGVMEGLFQTVVGYGAVGKNLLEQDIDGVFFTGSYATGKKISESVAGRMIKVQMELGGKDPAYICDDVDIKIAAEVVGDGAFFNAGQSCCAVERIYVHEKIYDDFMLQLVRFAESLKVGDPLNVETYIGCLARKEQVAVLDEQIKDAIEKGATLMTGGSALDIDGPFYQVTVLKDATHQMKIMREESFGPIIAVQKVANDQEAIRLMKDTDYGLTASVHTKDQSRAEEILSQMHTGTVYWNCCDRVSPHLPWTGRKHSGVGSTLSELGIQAFVQPKAWHLRS